MDPVEICIDLYGVCSCLLADREPCEAMVALVEDGVTADEERKRIAAEVADAELDWI